LAGIAIPRFLEATASARGAKIVADMRTVESSVYVYYAKNGKYPSTSADLSQMIQGGWPVPPQGTAFIHYIDSSDNNSGLTVTLNSGAAYVFNENAQKSVDGTNAMVDTGWITLGGYSVFELMTSGKVSSNTLTVGSK